MAFTMTNCPHCKGELRLNDQQMAKIGVAIAALEPGRHLKLGCPLCKQPIKVGAGGLLVEESPVEETPRTEPTRPTAAAPLPEPPRPPDIGWLTSGEFDTSREIIEDVRKALILVKDEAMRATIMEAFRELDFQTVLPESAEDAIEKMRFVEYDAVVYHSGFEPGGLDRSRFHTFMRAMAMSRRRYVYYMLVGPEFHTLYDLEALAASANMVVNNEDVNFFGVILRKGMHDYEELFGSYVAALKELGKQ